MKNMELKVKIKNGLLDLSASGVIIIDSSKPVVLTLFDNDEPMNIEMIFMNDPKNELTSRNIREVQSKNKIIIEFVNYNEIYGYYTNEPWSIGAAFGKELFFTYSISAFLESKMKKIEYSFLLGKEVKNG